MMHRKILIRIVLMLAGLPMAARGAGNAQEAGSIGTVDISAIVDELGSGESGTRQSATDRLKTVGEAARAALIAGSYSDNPETAAAAGQLLLQLPWVLPDEAPEIKQRLSNYGELPAEARCEAALELSRLPNGIALEALLRILREDPSAAVRWWVADVLRAERVDYKPPWERFRNLATEKNSPLEIRIANQNAALLAVAGWAWREIDAARASELLVKSVKLEAEHPSAVQGQMDFVYLWLIDRDKADHRFAGALDLLRQQAARTAWLDDGLPTPVANLFALQADQGPFPGLANDLRTYRAYVARPEMLYMLSRLTDREGFSSISMMLSGAAISMSGIAVDRHYAVGAFLAEQGWSELAERELNLTLWLSNGKAINVYFQLARIASDKNDDLGIAMNLEKALKVMTRSSSMVRRTRFGDEFSWSENDAWAEVHWHYLRAARTANDMAGVQMRLAKLMELNELSQIFQKDAGLATDIVPALDDAGRKTDADKCFDTAYADLRKAISADGNAEAKNNLAWLCARCGRKLDEAVKLSSEAMVLAPLNSAYLDTAAEANFRVGKKDEAIRLESRALELKPGDVFMTEQLERFRKK